MQVFNQEFGGDIFVYKRPHLREFLEKLSKLGTVSVFSQNQGHYADPIIDKLDPTGKIFKHRYSADHCLNNGDGQILKDMSVIEELLTEQERA